MTDSDSEGLLPSQWGELCRNTQLAPERMLLIAILQDACRALSRYAVLAEHNAVARKRIKEILSWVDGAYAPISFQDCVESGLSAEVKDVRRLIHQRVLGGRWELQLPVGHGPMVRRLRIR